MIQKILIATSNSDKFTLVSELFKEMGLDKADFYDLKRIHKTSTLTERGTLEERAKAKAWEFKNLIHDYGVIIGIDDGILLPFSDKIETELKRVSKQIIQDNILKQGDIVKICRAFYFLTQNQTYHALTCIPFIYHKTENIVIKPNSYPLSQVLSPLHTTTRISDLSQAEANRYYQSYCQAPLADILKKLGKETL